MISALVGFLFAFNAMLLTVPQRRRLIADLRREGYGPTSVIGVLALDALILGVDRDCALGLLLGDELSIHLFRANPGYLGSAFAVGTQRVVGWQSFAIAVAGGMLAAIVAVLGPLARILWRARSPRSHLSTALALAAALAHATALAGLLCLVAAPRSCSRRPSWRSSDGPLIAALLALLPLALGLALALLSSARAQAYRARSRTLPAMELSAARARAIGVAATGAIAVFGAVAIQGAHADLLSGLENAARDKNAFTDLWVSPPGAYDLLRTAPFAADRAGARWPPARACARCACTAAACSTGGSAGSG